MLIPRAGPEPVVGGGSRKGSSSALKASPNIVRLSGAEGGGGPARGRPGPGLTPTQPEDLPFQVEVWDETGSQPERLVAVCVTASLAYAAYYAAAREFFGREVSVRHNGVTIARWRPRGIDRSKPTGGRDDGSSR